MPFGINTSIIYGLPNGSPYNGRPAVDVIRELNLKAQNGDPTAAPTVHQISQLPEFQGIGWQGLLAMAGIIGGGALAAALGGSGAAGGAAAGGGFSSPDALLNAGLAVDASPAGAAAAGGGTISSLLNSPALAPALSGVGKFLEHTTGARTSTSTPTIAPEYKTLADLLRQRAVDRLNSSTDLSGYAANGISGINDVFKGINQSSNNNLTARGLASSPVAGAVGTNLDLARGGQIANFLNTLPVLQRQFQNEDMANAGNVLRTGLGTTGVAPGSAVGSALDDISGFLGYLYQQQRQKNAATGVFI